MIDMYDTNKYLNQFMGKNTHDILDIMATTPIVHCFGDSGEYYGYNYEKQLLPVDTTPVEYTNGFYELTIPLHQLDSEFSFDKTSLYLSMQVNKYYDEEGIYYIESMIEDGIIEPTYLFEDTVYNTYNWECNLERTIQYCFFEYRDEYYISLQIHNGCDVRGGYTIPIVFHYDGDIDYWYDMISYVSIYIKIGSEWAVIDSYDGYELSWVEDIDEAYPTEYDECSCIQDVFDKIIIPYGLEWDCALYQY